LRRNAQAASRSSISSAPTEAKPTPPKPLEEPEANSLAGGGGWSIWRPRPNRCLGPNPSRHSCHRPGSGALSDSWPKAIRMARSRNCRRCAAVNLFIWGRYFSTMSAPGVFFSRTFLLSFTLYLSRRTGLESIFSQRRIYLRPLRLAGSPSAPTRNMNLTQGRRAAKTQRKKAKMAPSPTITAG
jgi:hypothetical protein